MQFPACEPQLSPPQEVIEPLWEQPNTALNVLLVDDDELIRNSIRALLTILGHKTTLAESGEEAIAQLEAGVEPDVVILDINMPGLGGIGALPRMRVLRPQMPVLISTGRVDQAVLNLIAAHPFTTLLPKPFSLGQLREHIELLRPKAAVSVVPRHPGPDGGASRKDEELHSGGSNRPESRVFHGIERRSNPGARQRLNSSL
jgi:CheY-like chemotaxis protein